MRAKRRKVIVSRDYLDGIMGVFVRKPDQLDESYRTVDAALLDRFEEAERAHIEAGNALFEAFNAAPDIRNRNYESPEGDE